jgi:NAD dependent epimerase/dehydratase family enzyme
MSWVAMDDVVGAVRHLLNVSQLQGPVNVTSPGPVKNREFARELGRVLGRPALLPVPATALTLAFGEMAQSTILASARVNPSRLLDDGYVFQFPTLGPALRHVLGRDPVGNFPA